MITCKDENDYYLLNKQIDTCCVNVLCLTYPFACMCFIVINQPITCIDPNHFLLNYFPFSILLPIYYYKASKLVAKSSSKEEEDDESE